MLKYDSEMVSFFELCKCDDVLCKVLLVWWCCVLWICVSVIVFVCFFSLV